VAGGLQVPAIGNVGHWEAAVGEVRRCLIPETKVKLWQTCTALAEGNQTSAATNKERL